MLYPDIVAAMTGDVISWAVQDFNRIAHCNCAYIVMEGEMGNYAVDFDIYFEVLGSHVSGRV